MSLVPLEASRNNLSTCARPIIAYVFSVHTYRSLKEEVNCGGLLNDNPISTLSLLSTDLCDSLLHSLGDNSAPLGDLWALAFTESTSPILSKNLSKSSSSSSSWAKSVMASLAVHFLAAISVSWRYVSSFRRRLLNSFWSFLASFSANCLLPSSVEWSAASFSLHWSTL